MILKGLLIIFFGYVLVNAILHYAFLKNDPEFDTYATQEIEKHFSDIETPQITYFLNTKCKKITYRPSHEGEYISVAEPRNSECGSSTTYKPFDEDSQKIFEDFNTLLFQLTKHKPDKVEVSYSFEFEKINNMKITFSDVGWGDRVGYEFESREILHPKLLDENREKIQGNWFSILYNPSPF